MIKYFIGPMSKNVVDSILEFTQETGNKIAFIPSRRQIEYNGGYVNNWTTAEFKKYVGESLIVRDHSGAEQGYTSDDGYDSLREDCKYFDVIHIDPWKKYQIFEDGLTETINMIKFCHDLNENIQFEVGTEQSIRYFSPEELYRFVSELKIRLSESEFNQIKYLVIQSGTALKGNVNTGSYDKERLLSMISVCKSFNLISKEHNGDYIPVSLIREKFDLGLDSINIAPEFGLIETNTYLDYFEKNTRLDLEEVFFQICLDSGRWQKWVDKDFIPEENKRQLIRICGHYVLTTEEFMKKIKSQISDIDLTIKNKIKNKLFELYGQ